MICSPKRIAVVRRASKVWRDARPAKDADCRTGFAWHWAHIGEDSPAAADRVWQQLHERFNLLLKFPQMGESQDRFRTGLRSVVEDPYIIFYQPTPDGILIYRVIHGARRWQNLLPIEGR